MLWRCHKEDRHPPDEVSPRDICDIRSSCRINRHVYLHSDASWRHTHTHTHNLMIMATLLSHRRRRRRRHADAQHISDKQKRAHPENITLLGRARARKNALTTLTNINDTRSSVLCVFVLIYVSQKRAQDCRRAKCQPTTPTSPHPNFISYANFNNKCFSKLPVVFYARMSDAQS